MIGIVCQGMSDWKGQFKIMAKEKSRYFTFILYPESIPEDWELKLELIGVPMAISPLHDKDKSKSGGYKKPHYHVIYVAKNPVTADSVRWKVKKILGDKSLAMVQIVVRGMESMYLYLTHESKDAVAKKKHVYSKTDIKLLNNFDIDRYMTMDEFEKKELRHTLIEIIKEHHIINIVELSDFISQYGKRYGICNLTAVNDAIVGCTGLFRLYFDANYQNGFRTRYTKSINLDTGEVIEARKL
jgi:hypothetical protein